MAAVEKASTSEKCPAEGVSSRKIRQQNCRAVVFKLGSSLIVANTDTLSGLRLESRLQAEWPPAAPPEGGTPNLLEHPASTFSRCAISNFSLHKSLDSPDVMRKHQMHAHHIGY